MLVELGWYEATREQSINGIMIKEGYHVYVPAMYLHEETRYCHVKVRINNNQEYTLGISEFVERFRKIE